MGTILSSDGKPPSGKSRSGREPGGPAKGPAIDPVLIAQIRHRLAEGKQVRRSLGGRGRLHVDRELPFLCVYRPPAKNDPGTDQLVTGEASYLILPKSASEGSVRRLVTPIAETMVEKFGAFLLVEIWAKLDSGSEADPRAIDVAPVIEVFRPATTDLDNTIEVLVRQLAKIGVQKQSVQVRTQAWESVTAGGVRPLVPSNWAKQLGVHSIGIAVPPVYRDETQPDTPLFPLLLRTLRSRLGLALRRAFYEFARTRTTHRPPHYHELGRRAVVKAVWQVDGQLAEVSRQFDYLLSITPTNTGDAWARFKRSRFEHAPEFHYLPLPFDPPTLKRALFQIPVERIEDPALATIFTEKQDELDRMITMLADRNTSRFVLGSLQLFGNVSEELRSTALYLLGELSPRSSRGSSRPSVSAEAFVARAEREFEYYRAIDPSFTAKARVTSKVAGVMVSRGKLLVGRTVELAESRVDPLLQHEVGTHLVTYYNGLAQPFRQLASGLAGYEELQEGLAVLAEYLTGGLTRSRLRQLAGRVLVVTLCVDGASFIDSFRVLVDGHGFSRTSAYNITMRVYRGGGLTKDAIYLRGLENLVRSLRSVEQLESMFIGKAAMRQLGVIEELRHRGVLIAPPLRPRFLDWPGAAERLTKLLRVDFSIRDLIDELSTRASSRGSSRGARRPE